MATIHKPVALQNDNFQVNEHSNDDKFRPLIILCVYIRKNIITSSMLGTLTANRLETMQGLENQLNIL